MFLLNYGKVFLDFKKIYFKNIQKSNLLRRKLGLRKEKNNSYQKASEERPRIEFLTLNFMFIITNICKKIKNYYKF